MHRDSFNLFCVLFVQWSIFQLNQMSTVIWTIVNLPIVVAFSLHWNFFDYLWHHLQKAFILHCTKTNKIREKYSNWRLLILLLTSSFKTGLNRFCFYQLVNHVSDGATMLRVEGGVDFVEKVKRSRIAFLKLKFKIIISKQTKRLINLIEWRWPKSMVEYDRNRRTLPYQLLNLT